MGAKPHCYGRLPTFSSWTLSRAAITPTWIISIAITPNQAAPVLGTLKGPDFFARSYRRLMLIMAGAAAKSDKLAVRLPFTPTAVPKIGRIIVTLWIGHNIVTISRRDWAPIIAKLERQICFNLPLDQIPRKKRMGKAQVAAWCDQSICGERFPLLWFKQLYASVNEFWANWKAFELFSFILSIESNYSRFWTASKDDHNQGGIRFNRECNEH